MDDQRTLELIAALAEPAGRERAGKELAEHLGAASLFGFVGDEEIVGSLVPAQGFAATYPGGPGWRDLLARARSAGIHRGVVRSPGDGPDTPATAKAYDRLVLVFVGAEVEARSLEMLDAVAPLLEAIFRAEHARFVADGRLRVANAAAEQASALAGALDRTRGDLEHTLAKVEEQARETAEARQTAERATRAKDEFLAMLGHELRNPLAPIATALEILRLRGERSRELTIIARQVSHVMRLVDDLLDVSRITRGKIMLQKERVEIAPIVTRAVEMASPLLEEKRQIFSMDVAARGLPVEVDPSRLAQVVSNLLTNAARYSPVGARIELEARRVEDTVRLEVRDEGAGISPAMLEQIFGQFEQGHTSPHDGAGGLGLGLAIVRSLVELHGGRVWAQSAGLGRGSSFFVELAAVDGPAISAPRSPPRPVTASRPRRVLVVDDNDDASLLLGELLGELGYETRVASDGPDALRAAKEFDPEVAIVDIGLPVMDGYEVARRLRERYGNRPLHLIALTGYGQDSDRRRSKEAGFDEHLVKPVEVPVLQQLLARPFS